MPITQVTLDNPNLVGFPADVQSTTEYKELPRKYACLPDDGGDGTDAQDFCQAGCLNEPFFQFIVEPGDTIPLQFRFMDLVNPDPNNPEFGWRENTDAYFLRLEALAMDGTVLWSGPSYQVAQSYSVFMSDAGPVQNIVVNVDRLLNRLPPGTTCWFFRVVVIIAAANNTPVNDVGSWAGDPPYTEVGTIVVNTDPDNFGIYELTVNGWEFVGYPEDGQVFYNGNTGTWMVYHEESVIYTGHGAPGGGNFSFSKGSILGAFNETSTIEVNAFDDFSGGIVQGLRVLPTSVNNVVASIRRVRRWNGTTTLPSPASLDAQGWGKTTDGAAWSASNGDDATVITATACKVTRVGVADEDPGVAFVPGEAIEDNANYPNILGTANSGGSFGLDIDGSPTIEAVGIDSIAAFQQNLLCFSSGPSVWLTTDGGATWEQSTWFPLIGDVVVGRVSGGRVLMVSKGTGKFATNDFYGQAGQWSALGNFPDIGRAWFPTDIVSDEEGTVWVFGVENAVDPDGVLFRSEDDGDTWVNLPAASVLGGRAGYMGRDTLIATAYVQNEPGDTPVRAGTVYVSRDRGTTWTATANQPVGGAEAIDGRMLAGTFETIPEPPDNLPPGEDLPTDSATTMAFRLRKCDEPVVRFETTMKGVDCLGYIHTIADNALGSTPEVFQHDFKVQGAVDVEEYPIAREVTQNGRLKRAVLSTKARLRTWGLPRQVARRIQAVLGTAGFTINSEKWDLVDTVRKNNDDGSHWYLDTVLTREDCDDGTTCD